MNYLVAFVRDYPSPIVAPEDCTVLATCNTLAEAKARRGVAGDLVFYQSSGNIVPGDDWLWDWEKKSPGCYARRCQARGYRLQR